MLNVSFTWKKNLLTIFGCNVDLQVAVGLLLDDDFETIVKHNTQLDVFRFDYCFKILNKLN